MDEAEIEFSSVPELEELDNVLRCGICHEIIKTPVILSCSHTFCSLCIRKWLGTKQVCPSCSDTVYESSLRRNPMVENMVDALRNLKKILVKRNLKQSPTPAPVKKSLQSQSNSTNNHRSTNSSRDCDDSNSDSDFLPKKTPPITPRSNGKEKFSVKSSPSIGTPKNVKKKLPINPLTSPTLQTPQRNVKERPSTTPAALQSPRPMLSPAPVGPAQTVPKVPCPVCCQLVPETMINAHLDKCLAGESTSSSTSNESTLNMPSSSRNHNGFSSKTVQPCSPGISQSQSPSVHKNVKKSSERSGPSLEPIKKMVYNLFKDSQLKKELKKYGLSATGDRTALLSRLNRYVAMHNAECDATNPRSVEELRKAFDKEDKSLMAPPSNSFSKLFSSKQPNPDDFDKHSKEYIKQNKSSYDALIEEVRKRNQQKKESKSVPNGHVASTSVSATKVDDKSVECASSSVRETQNGPRKINKTPDRPGTSKPEISSSDDDDEEEEYDVKNDEDNDEIWKKSKTMMGKVQKKFVDPIVLDSSDSEINYSPLGKDSPVKRHSDDSGSDDDLSPEIQRTPSTSARRSANVKRKVRCIESESDEDKEKCGRPEKRLSLEGRSPILSRKTPVRRELRSRAPQNNKAPNQPEQATRRSRRNLKNGEDKSVNKPPSPDIFGTPPSSGDIPCGQQKLKSAESDDALTKLVSLIDDDASDSGSTTDFED